MAIQTWVKNYLVMLLLGLFIWGAQAPHLNARSINASTSQADRNQSQLPEVNLKSLMDQSFVSLPEYQGDYLFLSFFENECRWCLKQIKTYNQLKGIKNTRFVMAGVGESDFHLRHWAKRANPQIPVVKASPELKEIVGEIEATPFTLIFDRQGRFVTKVRGYLKQDKLTSIIEYLDKI